jgi:serine/threonine-protein kinase
MAPEQASGQPVTPATDVYSAGIVLYEMLAGRPPFGGHSAVEIALQHVQLEPPPLPRGTPRSLERVVQRALAKDPADRYQSAVALADALSEARDRAGAPSAVGAIGGDAGALGATAGDPSAGGATAGATPGLEPPNPDETLTQKTIPLWAGDRDAATEIIARDTRRRATGEVDPTRVAPRMSQRRTVNPAGRRRTVAVFLLALGVLVALLLAARALTAPATEALPRLDGLTAGQVAAKLRRMHLHAAFAHDYNAARPGTAFAQTPDAGARVKDGSTVMVAISKGPRPIEVPAVTGQSSTSASATLHHRGLKASVTTVAAPGTTPGVVVRQEPTAGHHLKLRDTVALFVAEVPSWHAVTSFSANGGGGHSVPFQIRGSQWRIVYSLSYNGTCDFVFFCSGPSAQVLGLGADSTNQSFDLNSGSSESRAFNTGPGVYQVDINSGLDDARWSIEVEDWL